MSYLAFTASCAECYRKNQRIAALEKLCQQQHEALEESAQSLETIARDAGKQEECLTDLSDVRAYAYNRANVARAAITAYAALFPKTEGAK